MRGTRILFAILVTISIEFCAGGVFYIGAIFDRNVKLNSAILKYAVETANTRILADSDFELGYQDEAIEYGNEFEAAQTVCNLLKGKANAIFAPKSPSASAHIASICDVKEIPYLDTYMDIEAKTTTINLYPSQSTLTQLLIDIVNKYEWTDFTILYEAPLYVKHIAPLLEDRNNKQGIVTIQPIEVGTNFRPILQKIKDMEDRSKNIIIESSIENLLEILDQILQVGLFTPDRSFIITNLDAQTIDLERFQYTQANVTIFRLIDFDSPAKIQEFKNIGDELDEARELCQRGGLTCSQEEIEELGPEYLQISTALIYDATMTLAETIKQLGSEHLQIRYEQETDCFDPQSTWDKGTTIINFMKTTNYSGLTGQVEFDTFGTRSNVEIDVMILTVDGLNKTGSFKPTNTERLSFLPQNNEDSNSDELPINQKTFKVIISVVDPYIMLKDTSGSGLVGNDRFEGFGIDIIDELSHLYGFKYIFVEQIDKDYGKFSNNTNEWSGMIGKVRTGEADLAIADLTINSDRIEALDFTPSFMNLGIALLYRKPTKEPPSTMSFMAPFSPNVWYYLGGAYILVSLCFFCLGRLSASQWENRYPCVEEPTFLENQFTLNNSMWFAAGALLQQGSEIEPKAASIRLASSFWWFFTLIMVSSYTANLAMFLVVENKTSKIDSVEDLKDCGNEGGECPVAFGAKDGGATFSFFKESTNPIYQSMYRYMLANKDTVMTKSNEEGIDRVYKGDEEYAFLMESKSIEYTTERKCNLTMVGKPLDDKNYGIGMRKDFKYAPQFNEGMLQLQEMGVLAGLQKKWWKERKGGGACSAAVDDADAVPLEMANIVGVFYVLIIGTTLALIYGFAGLMLQVSDLAKKHKKEEPADAVALNLENLKGVFLVLLYGTIFACVYGYSAAIYIIYRRAKQEKIPFKEELTAEIKFLLSCQGVKQVRHRKGSKSQCSGTSSRYSAGTNGSMIHGSNQLLNLE